MFIEGGTIKTKVLVFSSSGIDYITHPQQISIIPDLIKSAYEEVYEDCTEMDTLFFYERSRNDKYFKPIVDKPTSNYIEDVIEAALSNSYDRFIIFVNSNDIIDYSDIVDEILNMYPHLDITVIKINALGYPLAQLAIDSEKIVRNTDSIDNVISYANSYRDSFKVYFYSPKENVLPSIKRIDFDDDVISSSTTGRLYLYDGALEELRRDTRESYLEKMFEMYKTDIEDNKVIPFILYTNKYSLYNEILDRKLLSMFSRLKTIKKYPIPTVIGNKIGYNSIGIGFIKKTED